MANQLLPGHRFPSYRVETVAEKKVTQACYATGPIGRIVAEDALRSVQGAKKRKGQTG